MNRCVWITYLLLVLCTENLFPWFTNVGELQEQRIESWMRADSSLCQDTLNGCIEFRSCIGDCQSIPVYNTGSSQTLTLSGTYCLAEDIHDTIFIEGSDITLDLNGHKVQVPAGMTVSAIWVRNGPVNVRIKNGLVIGRHQMNTAGIVIEKAFNTRIEDVTIFDAFVGIVLLGPIQPGDPADKRSINAVIERVICSGNFAGIIGLIDQGTTVRDCILSNNYGEGLQGTQSDMLFVQNCVCNQNGQVGFGGTGFAMDSTTSCELVNCVADQNLENGFSFSDAERFIVRDCVASANGQSGFNTWGTSSTLSFFNCHAQDNGSDGFGIFSDAAALFYCTATSNGQVNNNNGFNIWPNDTAFVQGCTAQKNKGFGFNVNNCVHQLYSNVACLNGFGNYNGVSLSLIASPADARGVYNVDCGDTALDSVELILQRMGERGCAAQLVIDTGVDQFITEPGTYCLNADLSNTLTIQSSGVILNLNAHIMNVPAGANGIVVSDGISDVIIKNGFITGVAGGNNGVVVGTAQNVLIEDMSCQSCTNAGIQGNGSLELTINRVNSNLNGQYGVIFDGVTNGAITESNFSANGTAGIECDNADRVRVRACQCNGNGMGLSLLTSSNIDVKESIFIANTNIGFSIDQSNKCVSRSNFSSSNGTGFVLTNGASDVFILNNVSLSDSVAGFVADSTVVNSVIRECTANGDGDGFVKVAGAGCEFYSNSACDNTLNFNGTFNAPIGGADCAEYWSNVSCTFVCSP